MRERIFSESRKRNAIAGKQIKKEITEKATEKNGEEDIKLHMPTYISGGTFFEMSPTGKPLAEAFFHLPLPFLFQFS